MRKTLTIIGAVAMAAIAWTQLGAQQEMLSKPGPGSGLTRAVQHGDWAVAISNIPSVQITNPIQIKGPVFLKRGTYNVTWPNGDVEKVTIITMAADTNKMSDRSPELVNEGWVEVSSGGNRRWINIMAARSIQEAH